MRKLYLTIIMLLFAVTTYGQSITGTLRGGANEPLVYANATILGRDSLIVAGAITNEAGVFEIEMIPAGDYILECSYVGCDTYYRDISLPEHNSLGEIVLAYNVQKMDAFTVKSDRLIRRKADGYIFTPIEEMSMGINSLELLSRAPGVWYSKRGGIAINGKRGTRVIINNREINMSGEDLADYLASINAEQIKSIEVIPDSGAQYDASNTGGILKITLKRSTTAGLTGSAGMNFYVQDEQIPSDVRPSLNLEYRKDRLSVYTELSYRKMHDRQSIEDHTRFFTGNEREIDNYTRGLNSTDTYRGKLGTVYEITDRHIVGADIETIINDASATINSEGETRASGIASLLRGRNNSNGNTNRYFVSANYRWKTDEKGSYLTVIGDYMHNKSNLTDDNYTSQTPISGITDVIHNIMDRNTNTDLYTIRSDYKQFISPKVQLEEGVKFAYTDMHTLLDNQSLDNGVWKPRPDLDDNYLYRERIMAGYISGNFDLGNFNVIAGIRIENTDVKPHSNIRPDESRYQKYTDLFPTLRAMYFINRNRGHMINLGYNRYIRRPGFSELNPYRIQIDNYTYFIGNPDMKPSYTETISLAGIVAHKYSLTLSYDDMKDDVAQVILQDPTNPEVLYYQYANIDRIKRYTAALSLPLNIYGWWRMGVDGVYFYSENRIKTRSIDGGTFQGRLNNLFTLPGNWVIEANYMYLSGIIQGTMRAKSLDSFDVSLKKGFFDNKFTVSIFTNNIFDNGKWTLRYSTEEPGNFIKTARAHQGRSARTYGMTLRWNFRAGKEVKIQKVQSGNYEERAR